MPEESLTSNTKNKASITLDFRVIILLLLGVILAMTFIWKPWDKTAAKDNDRTISVTGEAKIKAEPDEYVFSPNYQFKNADKAVALAELTKKSEQIIAKLKELGVKDSSIKTQSQGNDYYIYYYDPNTKQATYSLSLSVTLPDREQAQKIQDYLVTTDPEGSVSPQANFSDNKRKELESQARDKATKEARAKADQSAKNLGFKVGAVKSVEDGAGFNNQPYYDMGRVAPASPDVIDKAQLGVQPGQDDLSYSVSVVYFLR